MLKNILIGALVVVVIALAAFVLIPKGQETNPQVVYSPAVSSSPEVSPPMLSPTAKSTLSAITPNAQLKNTFSINNGETKNTYYGYKSEESYTDEEGNIHEFIVLQYWYFYAFNDWKYHGGLNNHEGDWEVVMIFLDKDTEEPKHAAYSSHHNEGRTITTGFQYDSVRRGWDSDEINKNNDQIISFVALGSHANYPNNNDHLYTENWREKFVFDENNFPLWLTNYKGLWGVNNIKDKGPQGPYYRTGEFGDQINLFYNPIEWAGINNVGKKDISEITKTVNFGNASPVFSNQEMSLK